MVGPVEIQIIAKPQPFTKARFIAAVLLLKLAAVLIVSAMPRIDVR